jgi:hypothetical protein
MTGNARIMLKNASKDEKNNPDYVMARILDNGQALSEAEYEFKNDLIYVLAAVKSDLKKLDQVEDGLPDLYSLDYDSPVAFASFDLRRNRDAMLRLIHEDPRAYKYALPQLKTKRGFNFDAVEQNPLSFRHKDGSWQGTYDLAKNAVSAMARLYIYVSPELKSQGELLREIAPREPELLKYTFRDNEEEFVLAFLDFNASSIVHTGGELYGKAGFWVKAACQHSECIPAMDAMYVLSNDVVMGIVSQNGFLLHCMPEHIRDIDEVVRTAIVQDPRALKFASDRLKDSADLVWEGVRRKPLVIAFASPRLRSDTDFAEHVVREFPWIALAFRVD